MTVTTGTWPIVGHDRAVRQLRRAVDEGRVSHAYLLHGPPQVGKRALATCLAMSLLCERAERPCGTCSSCHRVLSGTHPDLRHLNMRTQVSAMGDEGKEESRKRVLGIDFVREHLVHQVSLSPYESAWKVFMLEDADRMRSEAANLLLKTLEEPPSYVVLLLLTDSVNMLLPTVVSRCQVLRLGALPRRVVAQALTERWGVEPARAGELAAISAGRIGWAIDAVRDDALLRERAAVLNALGEMLDGSLHERFAWANKRAEMVSRGQFEGVLGELDLWSSWWRDVLLLHVKRGDLVSNVDYGERLARAAERLTGEQIARVLRHLEQARDDLKQNANVRLALERLMLAVPSREFQVPGNRSRAVG